MIKKFICGFCNGNIRGFHKGKDHRFVSSRRGLRQHLRDEHITNKNLTNIQTWKKGEGHVKQDWWIEAVFDE